MLRHPLFLHIYTNLHNTWTVQFPRLPGNHLIYSTASSVTLIVNIFSWILLYPFYLVFCWVFYFACSLSFYSLLCWHSKSSTFSFDVIYPWWLFLVPSLLATEVSVRWRLFLFLSLLNSYFPNYLGHCHLHYLHFSSLCSLFSTLTPDLASLPLSSSPLPLSLSPWEVKLAPLYMSSFWQQELTGQLSFAFVPTL